MTAHTAEIQLKKEKRKKESYLNLLIVLLLLLFLSSNLFRGDLVVNDLQVQRLDSTLLLSSLMLTSQLMSNNLHFKNGGGVRRRNGDYNQLRLVTKEARGARACCVVLHVCGRAGQCFIHASIFFFLPPPQTTLFCVISICCDKAPSSFSQNGPLQIMSVIPNRGAKADFTPPLRPSL